MSADESSAEGPPQDQAHVEQEIRQHESLEDAIERAEPEVESGASSRSGGSARSAQLPSLQESAPGDWERAFAESPSMDRSEGRGPTDLEPFEPLDLVGCCGEEESEPWRRPEGDNESWRRPEDEAESWRRPQVVVERHDRSEADCTMPVAGASPDRVSTRRYAMVDEDVDLIERAPQSTPRTTSDAKSPSKGRKRPWEGRAADMPSAKCVVRRIGALIPITSRRTETKLPVDRLEAAAQALRQLLHAWKRLLGLTACAKLPDVGDRLGAKPSVLRRFCPALWMLVFLLIALGGIGLQWARCQRTYLTRLGPDTKPDNNTVVEYVCQHSFVWTYLLPRLIFLMGYISVFVSWFCLKHPDFITVVAEVYDCVTEQHEYPTVSERFINYCRVDRRLLSMLFVLVALMSAVGTLVGDGVIAGTAAGTAAASARDAKHAGVVLVADVFNFVVKLVHDNVMFFVLAAHTLSLKYFDLILQKTQIHLGNIAGQAHISSDTYVRPQYQRGHRLMAQAQAAVSAVLLMVLLRVCQALVLILVDQTQLVPRTESLGLLPLVVVYSMMVVYMVHRSSRLTKDGKLHHARHASTGPNFAEGGAQDADDDGEPLQPREDAEQDADRQERAPERPASRSQWTPPLEPCPVITGRLFGLDAAPWMYAALVLLVVCYCAGYFAVERYWPFF
ncbi:uncharacterized protein LOC122378932 isoform X1 [Amphibalanus amphitrite]|uniref:uncharacterized protein LOC122378932 isoform X1 n=1 Tax=Amphibalanus amphitrite TaxID=1232801 RepID=UPI001C900655|nr:uncharacterized protein LOC122378932 isoform X1 [Amphibalanus amphitrite]XP_043216554.1 uncharacterized protein LOC122378932 isoform X1 [Amphibalanus amphitrite]XP_043216555.1 uncharacterized protein LOC122378932 isoform X1 [Amphibalanus amphitrite]XP_043216556.1 uncharacterized protein LOC122378932 isoform X1 [Amphibalanus amphitrite]